MKIEVGTVIYIIDPDKKSVMPVRVNEQIVSRKLEGETITHKIETPSGKTVVLEKLDVTYFMSLEEVRDYLMERAETVVSQGIDYARALAQEKFASPEAALSSLTENAENPKSQEKMKVMLPDGNVANVHINVPKDFPNENSGN